MLQSFMPSPLVTNQIQHSLVSCKGLMDGTFDHCQRHRIRPTIWSPLTHEQSIGEQASTGLREGIRRIANQRGVSPEIVVLAWAMTHPTKPVAIVGTTRAARLASLADALDLNLTRQEWFELYQLAIGGDIP